LFPVQELESLKVPKDVTEKIDTTTRVMMGTNQPKPRCVALAGRIGVEVGCSIYNQRPTCCREFVPSYENGKRNPRCDQARKGKGLKALSPSDWLIYPSPEPELPPEI
jgi:uncharacterized protein